MTDRRVDITIKGHDESAEASAAIEKLNANLETLSEHAKHALEAFLGFEAIKGSIEKFGEAEQANARLAAVLNATGEACGFGSEALIQYAEDLQAVTTFSHESTVAAETTLAAFRNIKGDVFDDALRASQDLAAALGGDLVEAADKVGKALSDPGKGLKGLRQYFSPEERDKISELAANGHLLEAQAQIVERLKGTVGGASEAIASTATGHLKQFENIVHDVGEHLGAMFSPVLSASISVLGPAIQHSFRLFDGLSEEAAKVFDPALPFWKMAGEYLVSVMDHAAFGVLNWRSVTEVAMEMVIVKVRELGDVFMYVFGTVIPQGFHNMMGLAPQALSGLWDRITGMAAAAKAWVSGAMGGGGSPSASVSTATNSNWLSVNWGNIFGGQHGSVTGAAMAVDAANIGLRGALTNPATMPLFMLSGVNYQDQLDQNAAYNAALSAAMAKNPGIAAQMTGDYSGGGADFGKSGSVWDSVKSAVSRAMGAASSAAGAIGSGIPGFQFSGNTLNEQAVLAKMQADLSSAFDVFKSTGKFPGVPGLAFPAPPGGDEDFGGAAKATVNASTSRFNPFGYQTPENATAAAVNKAAIEQAKREDATNDWLRQIWEKLNPVTEQPFGTGFFGS